MRLTSLFLIRAIAIAFLLVGGDSYGQQTDSTIRITKWLNSNTHEIKTKFSSSNEDLRPLHKILSGKRLVSLGEATHGTKEFAEIKCRLFKFLVQEMGFNTFALEADFTAALAVNRYIQGVETDGERALKGLKFFHCVNQETLPLIHWMKEYNNSQTDENQKVKFYGFDFGFPDNSVREIAKILSKLDTSLAKQVAQIESVEYARLIGRYVRGEDIDMIEEVLRKTQVKYKNMLSENDHKLAIHLVEILRQKYSRTSKGNKEDSINGSINSRDLFMKQNVDWILNFEGLDARIMLWSHNDHARYGTYRVRRLYTWNSMGLALKKDYGEQLYTIGFDFNKGKFYANSVSRRPDSKKLTVFEVGDAPIGTLAWQLSKLNKEVFFLNFADAGRNKMITAWLGQKHRIRYAGGGYIIGDDCLSDINCSFHPYYLSQAFDGLIFVNDAHEITPLIK